MGKPITCYAVFTSSYERGRIPAFAWLGWSEEEVKERMWELGMRSESYEVRPVQTQTLEVGDIWHFPPGGPYREIPWVKILRVDSRKKEYGDTAVEVLLCDTKDFVPVTCFRVNLFEAYLMLYAEFVGETRKEKERSA